MGRLKKSKDLPPKVGLGSGLSKCNVQDNKDYLRYQRRRKNNWGGGSLVCQNVMPGDRSRAVKNNIHSNEAKRSDDREKA